MKLVLAILTLVSVVYCRGHVKPPDSHSSTGEEPPRVPLPDQLPFSDFTLANTEPKLTKLFNSDISTGEKDEFVHRKRKDCNSLGGQCVNKGEACPDQLSVETSLCNKSQRCCHPVPQVCPVVTCKPSISTTIEATTQAPTTPSPATTQAPTTPSPVLERCSSKGGVVVGQECFIFSAVGDELSWQDAVESCWQKYGPLASPVDPYHFRDYVASNYDDVPFWVGGYSIPNEKSFRWLNGTQIPVDRKEFPWASNEPTDPDGVRRCMQVNYGGGYAVQPCSNQQRYACNLDVCGLLGGVTLGYQCMKVNEDPLNFGEAIEACQSEGGRLIVPAYPQLLVDYFANNYESSYNYFWVGGLKTDYSNEDPWGYLLNGQPIPLGADNFPWADGEPNNGGADEYCLNLSGYHDPQGYNDDSCDKAIKYICELETSTTQLPPSIQFVIPQISSGNYIGPGSVFPNIQDNDNLALHFILDQNMHMTFEIVDGIWGYIRHVSSGKILTPFDDGTDTKPMNPKDGTRVVLQSDRRPWAFFSLDQYQNRIVHRSGKFISTQGRYITISGDKSPKETMEFQFMNPNNPEEEVLPYGYPVISGDWQLVFSVLNPKSTHTHEKMVKIGKSKTKSTSHSFKFGFEMEEKLTLSEKVTEKFLIGSAEESATEEIGSKQSLSQEMQHSSSATWSSEDDTEISFTVNAGESVAVWQRSFIAEHMGHKAVHQSNMFADTNSSRINPDNFGTHQRSFH